MKVFLSNDYMVNYAICPYEYRWSTKNKNLIEIQNPHSYDRAKNVKMINQGIAEIDLEILTKSATLRSNLRIEGIENLIVQNSQQCQNNNIILLPTSTDYRIPVNKLNSKVSLLKYLFSLKKFTLISSDQNQDIRLINDFRLSYDGQIESLNSIPQTLWILIKSPDQDQIWITIQILPVQWFLIRNIDLNQSIKVDQEIQLDIKYLDSMARVFQSNPNNEKFNVHTTDPKVAIITNQGSVLSIRGIGQGQAYIFLSLLGQYDYFKVQVGSVIQPNSPIQVHKGGVIDFSCISQDLQGGRWSSSNSKIFKINQDTGKGIALIPGNSLVSYEKGEQKFTENVEVYEATDLIQQQLQFTFLTPHKQSIGYQESYQVSYIPMKGSTQIKYNSVDGSINNNLKLDCATKQNQFTIETVIKGQEGICLIKFKPIQQSKEYLPKTLDLEVKLISEQGLTQQIIKTLQIPIQWGDYILDDSTQNIQEFKLVDWIITTAVIVVSTILLFNYFASHGGR